MDNDDMKTDGCGLMLFIGAVASITLLRGAYGCYSDRKHVDETALYVPYTEAQHVTKGSIVPSKLEITCLEGKSASGVNATTPCTVVATYDGKKVLLREGKNGIEAVQYVVVPPYVVVPKTK